MGGSVKAKEFECEFCQDEGGKIVLVPNDLKRDGSMLEAYRECMECKPRKEMAKLFDFSEIGEEFASISFDQFDLDVPSQVREMYHAAKDFADTYMSRYVKEHRGFMALGVPGTGKTMVISAICNYLMSRGQRVLYFPWVDGSRALRDYDSPESKKYGKQRIELMKVVPVLFIDDLFKGRDRPTNGQLEWLFEVVNYRYLEHLPILVSSERLVDDMMSIDSGIASRLYQMAKGYTVELIGNAMEFNYRLR